MTRLLFSVAALSQLLVAWGYYYGYGETSYPGISSQGTYTWSSAFPQSCSCMENGVTLSTCRLFRCTCACDLTAKVCDYGCCCDPDCSSDQLTRFQSSGSCPVSYSANNVPLCYSSVELYKINPRLPLGGQPTAEAAVADALCVTKYNYATKGEFYTTADVQDSVIFQQSKGQKDYSYGDVTPTTGSIDSNFDKGDNIAAFSYDSSTLRPFRSGYFSVPSPDFSGQCNGDTLVTFENPISAKKCVQLVSDMTNMCATTLSVAAIKSQYVAATSTVRSSSGSATTSDLVQVTISGIVYEDPIGATGTTPTLSDWTAGTYITFLQTSSALCNSANKCINYAGTAVTPTSTQSICKNAVKSVQYVVTHDGTPAGKITKVEAYIVITDVPTDFKTNSNYGANYALTTWTAADNGFVRAFGVEFNGAYSGGTVSSDTGNLVARARSGNPGYIMGKPVLFGLLSSSKISETIAGLSVPSSLTAYTSISSTSVVNPLKGGSGACPTTTASIVYTPLKFGYDMTTGCALSLTRAELKTLCEATTTVAGQTDSSGFPLFLTFADGYVGAFGNADPLDTTQWIAIKKRSSSASTRTWSDSKGTCTGMPTGLSYKFLVAAAGEKAFPQNKIISAEVEVIYTNFVWDSIYLDTTKTMPLPLTVTASFVNVDYQTLEGYAPPAPPVLFKVPYDVFYPFYMSPASARASISPAAIFSSFVVLCLLGAGWGQR